MAYWLMKSEPSVFSIDDLAKEKGKTTGWDGIRNYQARNNMRAMHVGDRVLFYHSNAEPAAAAGVMRIVKTAHPDPTQFERGKRGFDAKSPKDAPRWDQVGVAFERRFSRQVTLAEIKAAKTLRSMALLKNSRLSVQPVTPAEWKTVLKMAGVDS